MHKTIMIIAGEASGDLHGAALVASLKEINPALKFVGLGGERMMRAGVESYRKIDDLCVVGLGEVLMNLRKFRAVFRMLVEKLDSEKPDGVVLIDYPEFNLRFAKEVKKRNIPLIYYISPQIWAWRKGRIKTIKKTVKKMVVFFEFEKDFYGEEGIDVEFVGHPLLDIVKPRFLKDEFARRVGLDGGGRVIALFPGSREIAVKRNLPAMIGACSIMRKRFAEAISFVISKAPMVKDEIYDGIVKRYDITPKIIEGYPYDCISASDLVLVAAGTATLETAILGKPMLIIYKLSFLSWLMGRMLIKIPCVGLVNIIAGEKVVSEFIQFDAAPKKIAQEATSLLSSPQKTEEMKAKLIKIKEKLGSPQASKRAAEAVLQTLSATA